jgi:DNA-binding MltR family transcriptional regulator
MAAKQKKIGSDRVWPRIARPTQEAMFTALAATQKETDRGCAVALVAWFDELLEVLLSTHLNRMSGQEELVGQLLDGKAKGPLGMFSARAKVAVAMGLLDSDLLKPLLEFGKIRNRLGHKSAERAIVQQDIDKLLGVTASLKRSFIAKFFRQIKDEDWSNGMEGWSEARIRFVVLAMFMVGDLCKAIIRDKTRLRLIGKALDCTFFMCLHKLKRQRSKPLPSLQEIIASNQ